MVKTRDFLIPAWVDEVAVCLYIHSFIVLQVKPRGLQVLGKYPTTEQHLQPLGFWVSVSPHVAQVDLELVLFLLLLPGPGIIGMHHCTWLY
jgi:hypothetical protein